MDIMFAFPLMNTIFFGVFGLVIGSFLNVCIYRLPEGRTIVKGHSMCMSCGHELGALDLVPLFSWLFLRGKCRYCGSPIASRYAKIEGLTGLIFAGLAWQRREYFYLPGAPVQVLIKYISLFILLALAAVMIVSMMIQKDHSKGMYGLSVSVSVLFFLRLILSVFDISALRPVLVSAGTGLLGAASLLAVIIVITPFQRRSLPPHSGNNGNKWKTKSLTAYFAAENRTIRTTDVLFLAVAASIGFPSVIPCLCIYPVFRVAQLAGKKDRLLPYMGVILAASALCGVVLFPDIIF
jgi:prepilin signal peptidase PulO-like enzyme (type II secretory pathway)